MTARLSVRDEASPSRLPDEELVLLLSGNVELEKAQKSVSEAVRSLGFSPAALSRDDALAVLELLAEQPGIVGVAARFAKSRVHLRWTQGPQR